MEPERLQQIEDLYHAAHGKTAEERAALLAQADPELRREVESLLAQHAGGECLERPAIQNDLQLLDDSTLTGLAAGASLGPYRIEGKLGAGGMGEVYRAVDTRLGRAVAIKTTREQLSARFEREARAISSLNHPNICTLYDVGPNYLAMELVDGDTLAARLKSGPLPMKTALLYASQILAALAEAHEKGVILRDLKPGNIMIAKSGVKVLDFGLAKSVQDDTITASHMVMGRPAYMAPEQREGKPADARSDIYSFGCVLHEMLTGARVASRRKRIPSRKLESIVKRCVEEDPTRRWQSAADLARELSAMPAGTGRGKRPVTPVVSPQAGHSHPDSHHQHSSEMRADLRRPKRGSQSTSAITGTKSGATKGAAERQRPVVLASAPVTGAEPGTTRGATKRRRALVFASAAAMVLALATAGYFYFHRAPKLTDKDTIVLADFNNQTGSPVFDGTLRQGLAIQLEQSPFLSMITDQQVQQTLQMMGQRPNAKLAPRIAREICQRTGSAAVLDGSVAQIGTRYFLTVEAETCANGEMLASAGATASDENHVSTPWEDCRTRSATSWESPRPRFTGSIRRSNRPQRLRSRL